MGRVGFPGFCISTKGWRSKRIQVSRALDRELNRDRILLADTTGVYLGPKGKCSDRIVEALGLGKGERLR